MCKKNLGNRFSSNRVGRLVAYGDVDGGASLISSKYIPTCLFSLIYSLWMEGRKRRKVLSPESNLSLNERSEIEMKKCMYAS